jgi:hypothetical protein
MSISNTVRFRVLVRDHFTCRYCGRSAPQVEVHVDHVHPSSRGGSDDPSNLVAACVDCNLSKNGKVLPAKPAVLPTLAEGEATPPRHPLVGRYAHTFSPCEQCGRPRIQFQLHVLAQIADGMFLAQLFSWFIGDPTVQRIYSVCEMKQGGWEFYEAADEWRNQADREIARHKSCDDRTATLMLLCDDEIEKSPPAVEFNG